MRASGRFSLAVYSSALAAIVVSTSALTFTYLLPARLAPEPPKPTFTYCISPKP